MDYIYTKQEYSRYSPIILTILNFPSNPPPNFLQTVDTPVKALLIKFDDLNPRPFFSSWKTIPSSFTIEIINSLWTGLFPNTDQWAPIALFTKQIPTCYCQILWHTKTSKRSQRIPVWIRLNENLLSSSFFPELKNIRNLTKSWCLQPN